VKRRLAKSKDELVMEWYDTYYEDIYRFILFLLSDKESCEDFVHETFLHAYVAYDRFDKNSKIKTWLFSIAKHIVIDEIRKRQRRSLFRAFSFEKDLPSSFNVEQYVENKEMVVQLMDVLTKLKPNYRLVIILIKIEEYSTKETAEILNWSEAKVRKTLSRAITSLKRRIEIKGGEYFEQL